MTLYWHQLPFPLYILQDSSISGVLGPFGVDQAKVLQVLSEKASCSVYQALIKARCQTQQSTNVRGVWRRTINMCMRAYQGDTCIMRCWETQQHLEHPRAWNATLESQAHWSNRSIRISSGVISHPELFSSPRSQGFLFHCPVYRCMSVWVLLLISVRKFSGCSFPTRSELRSTCLHTWASQCQPAHTYQTGWARDYWANSVLWSHT